MLSRRHFAKLSVFSAAALIIGPKLQRLRALTEATGLRKFVWPLPRFGVEIPIAAPDTSTYPGTDYYRISIGEYRQQLHPELDPTRLWGFADATRPGSAPVFRHLGPAVIAERGRPVRVTFSNDLDLNASHPLPVDTSLPGAEGLVTRVTPHLHGGHVPWPSDGGPHSWIAPDGTTGLSRVDWLPDGHGGLNDDNWYGNDQSARLMWYHDHALGITRLNAYAGLAAPYLITDEIERSLVQSNAIPGMIPGTDVPLVIQDKTFRFEADVYGQSGDLWYPDAQDPADILPGGSPPHPSCVPEFFGDTMLMNGIVYPYLEVEPRRYRFRILNACNSRFVRLRLVYARNNDPAEPNVNFRGPAFVQIGTEAGFLPEPVALRQFVLGPAERADVIVDLSDIPVGTRLILYNDAAAPFPDGDPAVDFYHGENGDTEAGYGPNTRTLLQLRMVPLTGPPDPASAPLTLPPIEPLSGIGALVRNLTLTEDFDSFGRLLQRVGTDQQLYPGTFGRNYDDAPTETPHAGALEVWNIFNLTGDTHPIHFHLVNVQVIGRQRFKVSRYNGASPHFLGPLRPPDRNELGWKETVRMNPGEMTRVVMRFDLPAGPPGVSIPPSPRFPGLNAHEYVWHCHILEHEEHDMMRPLLVVGG
jgi:spore coat protein A, manganese oxidase